MTYTIDHEIKDYSARFVDESYLARDMSSTELREFKSTIFRVELAIMLINRLGCTNEPIEILPILLNWTGIDYRRYAGIEDVHLLKRNSLRLQTLRSVNSWSEALSQYLDYPVEVRLFELPGVDSSELSRVAMQTILFSKFSSRGNPDRSSFLDVLLDNPVTRITQAFSFVQREGVHHARIGGMDLEFDLLPEDIALAADSLAELAAIPVVRDHEVRDFYLHIPGDLQSAATRLGDPWPHLLEGINLRTYDGRILAESNAIPLVLNDSRPFLHLVGMTGARKSVLATLIAAWAIEQTLNTGEMHRVVLVHSTVSEALRRTQLLNQAFRNSIDEPPVAIPIFGDSGREGQIARFFSSAEFSPVSEHWGERFLASTCALQARLTPPGRDLLGHLAIGPGSEPCLRLKHPDHPSMNYICPFFAECPSRLRFADLTSAPVWIMNPWTFAFTRIPLPFIRPEPQNKIGQVTRVMELVAAHADLVITDESDVVQTALDSIWGPEFRLYGGQSGLYDQNLVAVTEFDQQNRVESAGHPWVRSFMSGWEAVNVISSMLTDAQHGKALSSWVSVEYFTLEYMLRRLARKLCGIPDVAHLDTELQAELENRYGEYIGTLLDIIRSILGGSPVPDNDADLDDAQRSLSRVRQALLTAGVLRRHQVRVLAREWLQRWVLSPQGELPGYQDRVNDIAANLDWKNLTPESPERLEAIFLFTLGLANLRHYTQLVTEQWETRPLIANLSTQQMTSAPYYADGLLPAPPLGQMFGFRIHRREATGGDDGIVIEAAEHRAIGRAALYELPELLLPAEGVRGPRVFTLSATSYMPDSEQFNLHVQPAGVLESFPPGSLADVAEHPVARSKMRFAPITDSDGLPIFVSGRPSKENHLRQMAVTLGNKLTPEIFSDIWYLAEHSPEEWEDRMRIVFFPNSYTQAEAMAIPLAHSGHFDEVLLLVRDHSSVEPRIRSVTLGDVEHVGRQTAGKRIALVAPLQSIGRGLNILNSSGVAAFGAAVFATRYYPPPGEFGRVVSALHTALYDGQDETDKRAYGNLRKMRQRLQRVRAAAELDKPYSRLTSADRRRLAADTTVLIAQAMGRLVRGSPNMVPLIGVFTDAAWAPRSAAGEEDTAETSLLIAMRDYMEELVSADPVFRAAHGPLYHAMSRIEGVYSA